MPVFDALMVTAADGTVLAQIAHAGPLERGSFDPITHTTWVPDASPTELHVNGFGIDSSGDPYYDTNAGAIPLAEKARLWVDAASGLVWVEPDL